MVLSITYIILVIVINLDATSNITSTNEVHRRVYDVNYIIICSITIIIFFTVVSVVLGILCYILRNSYEDIFPVEYHMKKEISNLTAMMRALSSSDFLYQQLTELSKDKSDNEKLKAFLNLLQTIKLQNFKRNMENLVDSLQHLLEFVGWDPTFDQDAFQLLEFLIGNIEDELNDSLTGEKIIMHPKWKLLHISHLRHVIQNHFALMLKPCGSFNKRPGVFLECLLDKYFEPRKVEDEPFETQLYVFQKAPDVMILHIQCNEGTNGENTRSPYYIIYNEKLNYIFEIHKDVNGSEWDNVKVTYQLMAVVHHMGSISGDHYITYIRHGQRWYLTNDEQVEEVNFKCDVVPYVMVYEKLEEVLL